MRDAAVVVSQSTDRSAVEDGPTEEMKYEKNMKFGTN